MPISIGGEIGEVRRGELDARGVRRLHGRVPRGARTAWKGLAKVSIQTGSSHGGVSRPRRHGPARRRSTFETLAEDLAVARESTALAGAVQHGRRRRLPSELFGQFPGSRLRARSTSRPSSRTWSYDHPVAPAARSSAGVEAVALRAHVRQRKKRRDARASSSTRTRKYAIGPFKEQFWNLPAGTREAIARDASRRSSGSSSRGSHRRHARRRRARSAIDAVAPERAAARPASRLRPRRSRRKATDRAGRRKPLTPAVCPKLMHGGRQDRGRSLDPRRAPRSATVPMPRLRPGRGPDPRARDRRLRLGQAHLPVGPVDGRRSVKPPRIYGHEFCGEIVAFGPGGERRHLSRRASTSRPRCTSPAGTAARAAPGQRHICENTRILGVHGDGCFAQYVVVPAFNVVPLDRNVVPPKVGAFLDALGNAVHTTQVADLSGKVGRGPRLRPDRRDVRGDRRASPARSRIAITDVNAQRRRARARAGRRRAALRNVDGHRPDAHEGPGGQPARGARAAAPTSCCELSGAEASINLGLAGGAARRDDLAPGPSEERGRSRSATTPTT